MSLESRDVLTTYLLKSYFLSESGSRLEDDSRRLLFWGGGGVNVVHNKLML